MSYTEVMNLESAQRARFIKMLYNQLEQERKANSNNG